MIQIGASGATIDSPIEHLMACHRRIEQRLETLVNAAGHLEYHRAEALNAIRRSLEFLDTSGALHTQDEEASLFPRLRPKLSDSEAAFVDSLEAQHVEAATVFADLKQLAAALNTPSGSIADPIASYSDCARRLRLLYRDHILAEDQILTALAKRSLGESEISEISREMRARRALSEKV
jgi:iron-sulfur cluster repair protein YtfE (RIC family)